MSLEVTGKLLLKYDTQQVSEKFKKREFVLELAEEINGTTYTNYAKMQLVQNKCEILDRYNVGDNVKVTFNIKGNKWERDGKVNYITSLDAWRIEYANAAPAAPAPQPQPQPSYNNPAPNYANNYSSQPMSNSNDAVDDLPF